MSKIGRKPISIEGLTVDLKNHEISYKGAKNSGVYYLPTELNARVDGSSLYVVPAIDSMNDLSSKEKSEINRLWGLHRALLSNELIGARQGFEKLLEINGLGYKAAISGKKLIFTLGYSHKIEKDIPDTIAVEIDKSGKKVTVKSLNKELAGQFCSEIRALRKPEPYKGKGIKLQSEVIFRKASKGKK